MFRNKLLINKMFFISMGTISFFIVVWAYYFHLRLASLGTAARQIYLTEVLPGLVVQGLVFAVLFRYIYVKTLGKRFRMFLDYLNACVEGDFSSDECQMFASGMDEISQAGQRVDVLVRFLNNLVAIVQDKVTYFKSMTLKLISSARQTDDGVARALERLKDCKVKVGDLNNEINRLGVKLDTFRKELADKQVLAARDALREQLTGLTETAAAVCQELEEKQAGLVQYRKLIDDLVNQFEEIILQLAGRKEIEKEITQLCEIVIELREQLEGKDKSFTESLLRAQQAVAQARQVYVAVLQYLQQLDPDLLTLCQLTEPVENMMQDIKGIEDGIAALEKCLAPLEKLYLRNNANSLLQATINLEGAISQFGNNNLNI
ncbi:MAG: hypothetical protein H0Z35_09820 [Thermoanaerobacteraceae bacterium]|nr:hypothetical protein [Thermoanaerobacteraceae bacterium]